MGVRRLRSLVRGLPADGALAHALRDDLWDPAATDSMLALLCELVDYQNRLTLMAWGGKNQRKPQPLRIPRPGEVEEDPGETVTMSLVDLYREGV